MGQILHGSASTTQAIRRAIQHSQESIRALARRHGINPKTVVKWRRRISTSDAPMGPKTPRSTVLSQAEEAIIVAFRKHTLLPLDDCLYAAAHIIKPPAMPEDIYYKFDAYKSKMITEILRAPQESA